MRLKDPGAIIVNPVAMETACKSPQSYVTVGG